ncbi:MAG: type II toxin-antitoxin system RelE/ParE family toxin [Hyphomicrobiales bacterium]|nr:type II toxin-antitoxin system RelE/ParE family toxin [Hyphomicrobiales bacterium]MBV8823539.1 type II toxin-antitoxin system RelE/ParE family toxin [Hyphomicrobiales bacterium]MBV9428835.1 type II toxin-antitoxin system RelE/ParE family toxin [Bradyrhizobiaceae bacterium]
MRFVEWSRTAQYDLERLIDYIAIDNPPAANRVAERIDRAARFLGDIATGRTGRVTGTYEKIVPGLPYILAYRIVQRRDGGEAIVIVRVIHGARKWLAEKWPD